MTCARQARVDDGGSVNRAVRRRGRREAVRSPYTEIAQTYHARWGTHPWRVTPEGRFSEQGTGPCSSCRRKAACARACSRALAESIRWGEPGYGFCPAGYILWVVPLMINAAVTGGLVAVAVRWGTDPVEPGVLAEIHRAAQDLLDLALKHNLTNGAALKACRDEWARTRWKARLLVKADEDSFEYMHVGSREDEAVLLHSLQVGDRKAAESAMNRMLTVFNTQRLVHPSVVRRLAVGLISRMCDSVSAADVDSLEELNRTFVRIVSEATAEELEQIGVWLFDLLESLLIKQEKSSLSPQDNGISRALKFMRDQMETPLTRDEVARCAGMSASHFSRTFRRITGRSFSEALFRLRVKRACKLLEQDALSLAEISDQCGFADQSHFTKVFKRSVGCTPRQYRIKKNDRGATQ